MTKILVVDDSASIRGMISTILSTHGYEVFSAQDGEKGISLAKAILPDLIITDIVMPNMDGFELIKEIFQAASQTKIIAISGCMSSYTEAALATANIFGVHDTLAKPISEASLLESVRRTLNNN